MLALLGIKTTKEEMGVEGVQRCGAGEQILNILQRPPQL